MRYYKKCLYFCKCKSIASQVDKVYSFFCLTINIIVMKKIFTLIAVAVMALAAQADVLTICDGTETNSNVPISGFNYDLRNTMSQMIYPAEKLNDMQNGKITEVKFYASAGFSLGQNSIQLSFKNVDQNGFDGTCVTGTFAVATGSAIPGETELVFTLDDPYEYTGDNLLIETLLIVPGSFRTTNWYGMNTGYPSGYYQYQFNWSSPYSYTENFLPKVTFTYEPAATPEPPTPAEGVVLVIVDQEGIEHAFDLAQGDDGDFSTTVTLDYVPYGQFYWDPELSYAENDANRPAVPFYFLIDGMRYGAEDLRPTVLGYAMSNPLDPEAEGFYTVPVGFSYNLGVAFKDGGYYVYAAVSTPVSVDELNAGKTVAGMRYFNVMGQEMAQPEGMTIVVTTYTDGTSSTVKVMK